MSKLTHTEVVTVHASVDTSMGGTIITGADDSMKTVLTSMSRKRKFCQLSSIQKKVSIADDVDSVNSSLSPDDEPSRRYEHDEASNNYGSMINEHDEASNKRDSTSSSSISSRDCSSPPKATTTTQKRRATKRKSNHSNRLTVISFVITIGFIISYLPHVILVILRTVVLGMEHDLSTASLIVYNVCLRSPMINTVINIFVYGTMNVEFRNALHSIWTRLKAKVAGGSDSDGSPKSKMSYSSYYTTAGQ